MSLLSLFAVLSSLSTSLPFLWNLFLKVFDSLWGKELCDLRQIQAGQSSELVAANIDGTLHVNAATLRPSPPTQDEP